MTLTLLKQEYRKIVSHAEQGYPHEVVGLLGGDRNTNAVYDIKMLFNERGDTKNRYKVSGLTILRAEQELERQGLELVGYYHSHPDHPSQYSEYDREHALPNMSYLIISIVQGKENTVQSWRLTEDREQMEEEKIAFIEPSVRPEMNR